MSLFLKLVLAAALVRPANTTQYAAGDLVANHATAGSVEPVAFEKAARYPGAGGRISAVRIAKTSVALTDAAFRVHLFLQKPTVTGGDNAVLAISNGIAKGYLGSVDVTIGTALGDGAFGRSACDVVFDCVDGSTAIYALVEAIDTYTPASGESFTVSLECERA